MHGMLTNRGKSQSMHGMLNYIPSMHGMLNYIGVNSKYAWYVKLIGVNPKYAWYVKLVTHIIQVTLLAI